MTGPISVTPEPFGFRVLQDTEDLSRWRVLLPHQCEDWDIAGDYGLFVSHPVAVAELTRFIDEARAALADLVAERERLWERPWTP